MYDVWQNVLETLKPTVSSAYFATFFKDSKLLKNENGEVVVGAKNVFSQTQMKGDKLKNKIVDALKKNHIEVRSFDVQVIRSDTKQRRHVEDVAHVSNIEHISKTVSREARKFERFSDGLIANYTMDNFVVGSGNDVAAAIAKNVIEEPGGKYNPFFLYSRPGLGKTHLVQAIGNKLKELHPEMKILYTPTSKFFSEYIEGITTKNTAAFTKKYEGLDCLIIDDFQQIIGKDASQEQFFNIFNDMKMRGKQIVITCDRLPEELKELDPRLTSRLSGAGAWDISMPSFEDRVAILRAKADFEGTEIEDEAIQYIAENSKENIRDMEGRYAQIVTIAEIRGMSPLELIRSGQGIPAPTHNKTTTSKKILEKVAKHYQLTVKEMCGKSRVANIKNARQVAMYLLSEELGFSTTKAANEVGLKDHTTAMHGIERIKNELKLNFNLRDDIEKIREAIYE